MFFVFLMKRLKTNFFRLTSNKIVVAVLAGIIFLTVYFLVNTYLLYIKKSKETVYARLESIVTTASIAVDGDEHRILTERYSFEDDVDDLDDAYLYRQLHKVLSAIHDANKLESPINTIFYDSLEEQYLYAVSSQDTFFYRHPYGNMPEDLRHLSASGGISDVYLKSNGSYITALAPIKDAKGRVVGLIQLDEEFDEFQLKALNVLIRNIIFSLLIVLALTFFLTRFIKLFISREERLVHSLREQNQEIVSQKEELESQSLWIQENNLKLEDASKTIEKQNKELKIINQMLDFKVEQRTKELEKANEDLGTFLYRSSHDIIGPIATLNGLISLGKLEVQDQLGKDYIYKIGSTTQKLSAIIRHINSVFEIKKRDLEFETFNLKTVADKVLIELKNFYPEENIDYIVDLADDLEIKSDKDFIQIIVFELMKNSIIYKSKSEPRPFIKLTAAVLSNKLTIYVTDNGIGINTANEMKIFEMFQRATEVSQGTGLGLYIVKSILDRLKGRITLLKKTEPGTTFEIKIPLKGEATLANPYLG